jgi:hypothetical protein
MTLLKGFAAGSAILVLWGLLLIHVFKQANPMGEGVWCFLPTETLWEFTHLC